jgi:signal transduction histidine kinase
LRRADPDGDHALILDYPSRRWRTGFDNRQLVALAPPNVIDAWARKYLLSGEKNFTVDNYDLFLKETIGTISPARLRLHYYPKWKCLVGYGVDQPSGAVRLQFLHSKTIQRYYEYLVLSSVVLLVVSAFSLGTVILFMNNIVIKPIQAISRGLDRVKEGEWGVRVDVPQADELGALAGAFNQMSEDLKLSHEEVLQAEKLSALGEMLSGITHELKNPLTSILMVLEVAEKRFLNAETPPPFKESMAIMHRAADHMLKIVSDFTMFARQDKEAFEELDVKEAIESLLEFGAYHLEKKSIEIRKEYQDGLVVWGNKSRLQQVILNLISNAGHATPEGGTFTIRTRYLPAEEKILMEFADTGSGIDPKVLPKIFDPFYTTKPRGQGTGLGLSVSYGIIKRHNGSISAESTLGRGTTFSVLLPGKITAGTGNGTFANEVVK